ncbi:hypothetical protein [Halomonas huangheensis]|uniref:Uncharacterized protein n=1 Tax=Halomonas huangheensis TaxID=1178482 RepID=W1NCW1_9GAMM|nr:hypothetical protein [Halomonas huangheensis]ERL53364.1 hypothetical protein BJB45_07915 [Halomonas huangheensis]
MTLLNATAIFSEEDEVVPGRNDILPGGFEPFGSLGIILIEAHSLRVE